MITSTHNAKVQQIRELQAKASKRREAGAFVVEGVRLAEEALRSGWEPLIGLYTADVGERGLKMVREAAGRGAPIEEAASHVFKAASDTQTPQGILLVLKLRQPTIPANPDFVLVIDAVRDPGNLGTLLRTAEAAGVQAVILSPGTADAFAPKVVRSAMGAHFNLPAASMEWDEINKYMKQHNLISFLADSGGGLAYDRADLSKPLALIVGGEAQGPGAEAQKLASEKIHIPMPGNAESLNAAVAGAVLMFEVVRQRLNHEEQEGHKKKKE
jgi:RNA methyltransferase, TrmH family